MIVVGMELKLQSQLRLHLTCAGSEATPFSVQWAGAHFRSVQNSCSLCSNYSNKDIVKTNIRNENLVNVCVRVVIEGIQCAHSIRY